MAETKEDIDQLETSEWLIALDDVIRENGVERARYLLEQLLSKATKDGIAFGVGLNTPYVNTINKEEEAKLPGDYDMERRIGVLIRWNAAIMVLRAVQKYPELGGHLASFASAAVLYDVGFNYFFHAPTAEHGGDLIYAQGHSAPGIYARSFLEGRLSEEQVDHFRQEVEANGLSSYPHPWLMPDYWQFATVSMGLGPLMGVFQARFLKYLEHRKLIKTQGRKVWVFCGDGEMDEPESTGGLALAAREKLDNLVFVINCNLQRLDGPVRGNGKIIQELERLFNGAGWNVIKVVWGRHWDPLLASNYAELLMQRMEEAVDGDYQNYKSKDGAYVREHFFGKYPELRDLVSQMTDEQIWRLNRGGHDPYKVYAAYKKAVETTGQPTVILAKTVKGYGLGSGGEGRNTTHNTKKMDMDDLKRFRDRFQIPISDEEVENLAFYRPSDNSPEIQYMKKRREALGGTLPSRSETEKKLDVPSLSEKVFDTQIQGSGERAISTTMAFVRMLSTLLKDKNIGPLIVPIVPDESRTFGMEGLFRQCGIYSHVGQLYEPVDAEQVMYYREDISGQILQEGLNEPGAMASWIAAATSYSHSDRPMIPFYIYYSMFGFQRTGDLAWAAGDMRAKGFLLGATSGRTTLAGEGLQHQDGHSHVMAGLIPNCISYDPTFNYELAVIIQDGLRRMYSACESVFYYITVMNENYEHPSMPTGAEEGILKGMYLLQKAQSAEPQVTLMGCGTILLEVQRAAEILATDFDIAAEVWSVTSFNELTRDGQAVKRHNRLHPGAQPKQSYVEQMLAGNDAPVIAATDYVKNYADQIRSFVPRPSYTVLGTDGFGRSDTRQKLRHFFEVDYRFIVCAALKALADENKIKLDAVEQAMQRFEIDPEKVDPTKV